MKEASSFFLLRSHKCAFATRAHGVCSVLNDHDEKANETNKIVAALDNYNLKPFQVLSLEKAIHFHSAGKGR